MNLSGKDKTTQHGNARVCVIVRTFFFTYMLS